MKIYFVRHGESLLTEGKFQLPDTPLSESGYKQADAIAKRFIHISLDLILSSSYTRALQTAQEIEKIKSVPLIQSDLLIEREFPSVFLGKDVNDPDIVSIHQMIREHVNDDKWHYSDEENFYDLLLRVKKAVAFIISHKKENIAVVTHGYFLVLLINFLLFGDNVNPHLFKLFKDHTTYSNTGLTMCEFKNEQWKILTWNDFAHLGE